MLSGHAILTVMSSCSQQIVIGFATGIMQATVPCYVTEVSPREIRGIMLSFFNMASEYDKFLLLTC